MRFAGSTGHNGGSPPGDRVGRGRGAEPAPGGHLDPDRWHQEWATRYLRERRYERALRLMTPLRAAHHALDDLRNRHRIRPTFQRRLDTWQAKTQSRRRTT
jgi:hypothetical protein